MRYFLSGLGLFVLMSLFARNWYVHTASFDSTPPDTYESNLAVLEDTENYLFFGDIILKDNLLLKPNDYTILAQAVNYLKQHPKAMMFVYLFENVQAAELKNTLITIFSDQGIGETRCQFLRKPTQHNNVHRILLRVE